MTIFKNNKLTVFSILCLGLVVVIVALSLHGGRKDKGTTYDFSKGFADASLEKTDAEWGTDILSADAGSFKEAEGVKVVGDPAFSGKGNVVLTEENSSITFEFDVKNAGMYSLEVEYMPAPGNENDIERNILIDGALPSSDAQFVSFTRIWKDETEIRRDLNGNDIRPLQIESTEWKKVFVFDSAAHSNLPVRFFLSKGKHKVTLEGVKEPMYLANVTVRPYVEAPSYAEVKAGYDKNGFKPATADLMKFQAENMFRKSDYTLYQSFDKTSAITEPQDASKIRLNCISGDKFKLAGQWISWEIEVPETGLYNIGLRYKQNILSGIFSSRRFLIDGEIPFKEAGNLQFNYSGDWKVENFGNGEEDYLFLLEKGKHIISMEVTLGDMAETIDTVEDILLELNKIYREILVITGSEADIYRDYNFGRLIPETVANMKVQSERLAYCSQYFEAMVGAKGEQAAPLDKLSIQLALMNDDPNKIASNFTQYKDNIAGLAEWMVKVSDQPLSIDYFFVSAPGAKLPKAEAGFFTSLGFELKSFVMSFFTDYSTLGQTEVHEAGEGKTIEVWITSGRDQANIIRQMINNSFTPQTGINVELKLVSAGSLLPAVLSEQGPDVALGNPLTDPIQYALRNAVIDLTEFADYKEVSERFTKSALVSYTFENAVYALPETQTFPIMFYRKDIFEQLGLTPPDTWDDFMEVVAVLQRNNMEVGFPQGMGGMQIFLYQNGGSLYNEDLTACTFTEDKTLDAFQSMLDLFTTYRFPRDYSFSNRFRTGQMPLAIQDYLEYNQLSAFAPEIKGLWGMLPIPGTMLPDGSIDRACACGGTCAMMLRGVEDKESAWRFMEWWTRSESQTEFAQEMKSILGKAAMHATANIEAIGNLPWTKEEYTALYGQLSHVEGTPEVPGNYFVIRNIGFASVSGYTSGNAEELLDWAKETNDEITRKRKEFGLE
ncbi:MAG: extracellular solute-binding protein [Lachnospiraceae bacterium]|nr:extracellular solute-binding protein [Lachnospiraceae bacterium]